MGGSASALGTESEMAASAVKAIDAVYHLHKDSLSDAELLELMKREWERLENSAANAVTKDIVDVPVDKVAEDSVVRAARNEEFLIACGKYHKGSSAGNLNKAMQLHASTEGIDIDSIDSDGWSALIHASGEGHVKTVIFLIENKATVDFKDLFNCTPLYWAAFNNRRDIVKLLLIAGADETIVGCPEDEPKQTASLAARRNNNPGIADFIEGETQLRKADPERIVKQRRGEMTTEEFNNSLRKALDKK